jgi:hypothetical protein
MQERTKSGLSSSSPELIAEEAIEILLRAGYVVQKRSEQEERRSQHPLL